MFRGLNVSGIGGASSIGSSFYFDSAGSCPVIVRAGSSWGTAATGTEGVTVFLTETGSLAGVSACREAVALVLGASVCPQPRNARQNIRKACRMVMITQECVGCRPFIARNRDAVFPPALHSLSIAGSNRHSPSDRRSHSFQRSLGSLPMMAVHLALASSNAVSAGSVPSITALRRGRNARRNSSSFGVRSTAR